MNLPELKYYLDKRLDTYESLRDFYKRNKEEFSKHSFLDCDNIRLNQIIGGSQTPSKSKSKIYINLLDHTSNISKLNWKPISDLILK